MYIYEPNNQKRMEWLQKEKVAYENQNINAH